MADHPIQARWQRPNMKIADGRETARKADGWGGQQSASEARSDCSLPIAWTIVPG